MWTVKFEQDTDKPGVGTVYAVNGEFYFADRVDTNSADAVDSFVSKAKEKYASVAEKVSSKESIVSLIAGKLEA